MKTNPAGQRQPSSRLTWVVVLGLVIFALAGGGTVVYWQVFSGPSKPWLVKWQINRYLKKQSGKRNFAIAFKFPSEQEMRTAPPNLASNLTTNASGALVGATKKDWQTLTREVTAGQQEVHRLRHVIVKLQSELSQKQRGLSLQEKAVASAANPPAATNLSLLESNVLTLRTEVASLKTNLAATQKAMAAKEKDLALMVSDQKAMQAVWAARRQATQAAETNALVLAQAELAKETKKKFDEALTYRDMYTLVGQQLWVADKLLDSLNPLHRRVGLNVARQASGYALDPIENAWLGARICEAYVWPNLDAADDTAVKGAIPPADAVLTECVTAFSQADETNNVIRIYETMLARNPTSYRADLARFRLALVYEQAGDYAAALYYLRAIKATNSYPAALRRIPWIEQRLKAQKKKP